MCPLFTSTPPSIEICLALCTHIIQRRLHLNLCKTRCVRTAPGRNVMFWCRHDVRGHILPNVHKIILVFGFHPYFRLAWFITYSVIMVLVSLVIALLSKYAVQIVPNGNFLILYLIMLFYGMTSKF